MEFNIDDIRTISEFKGITFSGYKLCEVSKALYKSISNGNIDESFHWVVELICSGNVSAYWEVILLVLSKNINIANPKLPYLVSTRYEDYKSIERDYKTRILDIRNNIKIRSILCEVVAVLTFSNAKPCYEKIIITNNDFNIDNLVLKLDAHDTLDILEDDDPKELYIGVNELVYHIKNKSVNSSIKSCYWIAWILEMSNICKKKDNTFSCSTRSYHDINDKNAKDSVWIIWDILINESNEIIPNSNFISCIIQKILQLFCINYTPSCIKKRIHLIYYAVQLLTEPIDISLPLVKKQNENKIKEYLLQINNYFVKAKSDEHSSKTDYLFSGIETSK
jgi:hypothetical protein